MTGKAAGEKENKSENLPLFIEKTLRVKVFIIRGSQSDKPFLGFRLTH